MKNLGTFYFRDEGTGCISGKFVNNAGRQPEILPEAAKRIGDIGDKPQAPFEGKYSTIWMESVNESAIGELKITEDKGVYELEWTRTNGTARFKGLGILADGLLVGSYKGI